MYPQMLGSLVRGEETFIGLALVQQRAQLLTRAWVGTQLVENRQDQCLRYSRLSAGYAHPMLQGDWRARGGTARARLRVAAPALGPSDSYGVLSGLVWLRRRTSRPE